MTLQRRLALTLVVSAVPLVAGLGWVRSEIGRRSDVQIVREITLARAQALGRERCESDPARFLEGPPLPFREPPGGLPMGRPMPGRRPAPPAGTPPTGPPESPEDMPTGAPPGPLPHAGRLDGPPPPGLRPTHVLMYDATYRAASLHAPAFPAELRQALERGDQTASRRIPVADERAPLEMLEVAVRTGWGDGPCAVILARRVGPPASAPSWALVSSAVPLLLGLVVAVWVASGPLVRRVRTLTHAVRRSADSRYELPVPETGRDELTDLSRAFNEAGAQVRAHLATLERRDRTLREFLANTTHDVMIPLTVLQGHLSALQAQAARGDRLDPAALVAALQEAHYMASLLHNLGAAAKLEAPDSLLQRHAVDLNALVERVVERHRPVAGPAGISIEFAVPEVSVTIHGDVTLLEQAVSNVVHNAVRYNRPGGHVAVLLETSGTDTKGFRLRVLDDGPGVPEDRLARLSERRYRDDEARQRDPNGLGLGLSIAREVAERHGLQFRIGRAEQGGLEVELRG